MNYKTTLALALAVLVAAGAIYLITQAPEKDETEPGDAVRLFPELDSADITRIEIDPADDRPTVVLERDDEGWRLSEPAAAGADRYEADDLARRLANLGYRRAIDLDDKAASEYGLAEPEATVTFVAGDETYRLAVGREAGLAREKLTYVRLLPDGDSVYLAREDLHETALQDAGQWRDKSVVGVTASEIDRVTLNRGDESVTAERVDGRWAIVEPLRTRGDREAWNTLVRTAAGLQASSFVTPKTTEGGAVDWQAYGLAAPRIEIVLVSEAEEPAPAEGEQAEAETEPAPPATTTTVAVGGYENVEETRVYVRVDEKTLAVVEASDTRKLEKTLFALRAKQVVPVDKARLVHLGVELRDTAVAIDREDAGWRIVAPKQAPAESSEVGGLISDAAAIEAREFADGVETGAAEYGLDKPFATVTYRHRGDSKDTAVLFGRNDKGEVWAMEVGSETVARIDMAKVNRLDRTWLDLRKRELWAVGAGEYLARIAWSRGGETVAIERDAADAEWRMAEPVDEALDQEAVAKLTGKFGPFKVREFLATADRRGEYGLDKPEATIQVAVRDAEGAEQVHRIVVTEHDHRTVAMLDGGSLVFEPPVGLLSRLTEPMSAEPWLDFDTEQVTRLRIQGRGMDLTFDKAGERWVVSGTEEFDVNPMKVRWYLGDVAATKPKQAIRYAAEDLAEYGLDNAAWRIDLSGIGVETSILLSEEGPGSQVYATVQGSGRVVTLETKDKTNLMRDAAYFRAGD